MLDLSYCDCPSLAFLVIGRLQAQVYANFTPLSWTPTGVDLAGGIQPKKSHDGRPALSTFHV